MGTKRAIAEPVCDVIEQSRPGPLLDLFSGLCAIGTAVGPARNLWANDCQHFAWNVATAYFCSSDLPLDRFSAADLCRPFYLRNFEVLTKRFSALHAAEICALKDGSLAKLKSLETMLHEQFHAPHDVAERKRLRQKPSTFPYRLFTLTFSASYLGFAQCMETDSIVYSVHQLRETGKISEQERRWLMLALCQAMSRASASTGHFAQHLTLSQENKQRYFKQRCLSIWALWLQAIDDLSPVGSKEWRSKNRAFRSDALKLLSKLAKGSKRPSVIYADPPYTADHYSRYYHLYETLLLYDYPDASGKGRYRSDRHVSAFSVRTRVESAIDALISRSASCGADLVLSYPTNGLMPESRTQLPLLMRRHYRKVESVEISHFHSAMGGSKGEARYPVTEMIYRAIK